MVILIFQQRLTNNLRKTGWRIREFKQKNQFSYFKEEVRFITLLGTSFHCISTLQVQKVRIQQVFQFLNSPKLQVNIFSPKFSQLQVISNIEIKNKNFRLKRKKKKEKKSNYFEKIGRYQYYTCQSVQLNKEINIQLTYKLRYQIGLSV